MAIVTHIADDKALAITIDDGPNPETTPMLLSLLASFGAKASFFVIGRNVRAYPALAEAIVAAGHDLLTHGFSHRSFLKLSPDEIVAELAETEALLSRFRPTPSPYVIRPPYGHVDEAVTGVVRGWRADAIVAKWHISALEWRILPDCRTPRQVLDLLRPQFDRIDKRWAGAILLMHDWPTLTADPNLTSGAFAPLVCAAVMERYLDMAKAKGLACLRLSDCFRDGTAG